MRYKGVADYKGTNYSGWQRQNNAPTIQEVIERAISTVCHTQVTIVGCGRTDAGVHARNYIFHFDVDEEIDDKGIFGIDALCGNDIAIRSISQVETDFHARFDAKKRTYQYHIHWRKSPFVRDQSFFMPGFENLDFADLQNLATHILSQTNFYAFCKAHSDARHYKCAIIESHWSVNEDGAVYTVSANRFLRGMVRLLVGSQLDTVAGKLPLEEWYASFEQEKRLSKSWSVPAEGLFLVGVEY